MNGFIRTAVSFPTEGSHRKYRHFFGGELKEAVIPPGGEHPCHLLYTIDTEDPGFPVSVKGVRYLPLIYCQQYNAAAMAYRVQEDRITVDWIDSLDWSSDFPYDDYPASFPRVEIYLKPADLAQLAEEEKLDEDTAPNLSRFGGWHWLCQGIPDARCRNPGCGKGTMDVFGVINNHPVQRVFLWNPDDEWDDVETIYQICSECSSIHVCNRCS